jgi:hypothetical protein
MFVVKVLTSGEGSTDKSELVVEFAHGGIPKTV